MKSKVYLILLALFSVLYINACKDKGTEPDGEKLTGVFFPNSNGTWYKYSISTTDSAGGTTPATRSATYQGTQVIGSANYQVQIDSIVLSTFPQAITNNSHFKVVDEKDNKGNDFKGVYYYVDTTGFSSFIPDSMKQFITVDSDVKLLTYPFSNNLTWTAFKVHLQYLIFSLEVIMVQGYYVGTENISINLSSGAVSKQAAKVRYVLTLNIPTNLSTFPPTISTQQYEAHAWVVEGIGIVKWEGNGAILGAFTGAGIDLGDTTSVVSQNLIQYDIK